MKKILLVTLTILAFNSLAFAQETFKRQVNSARECAVCHYEMVDTFLYDNTSTEIADYPKVKQVASEKMCFSCHDGSVGDSRDRVWNGHNTGHSSGTPLKEGMRQKIELPLVDGKITCMTCHTAHTRFDKPDTSGLVTIENSLFLRIDNDKSQLCENCHEDRGSKDSHPMVAITKEEADRVVKLRGRIANGKDMTCESCHTVHGANPENKNLLIASTNDLELCKTCHQEMIYEKDGSYKNLPHIPHGKPVDSKIQVAITKFGGKLGNDQGLACFSCHTMHKAKGRTLLTLDGRSETFCIRCHEGFDEIMYSPHNLADVENYKTVDNKTIKEVGVCGACHGGHQWRLGQKKNSAIDATTQLCVNCHTDLGAARKKSIDLNLFNHYVGEVESKKFLMTLPNSMKELPVATKRFLQEFMSTGKTALTASLDRSVTCASCHDIHSDNKAFLRVEITNGALCTKCHTDRGVVASTPHGVNKDSKMEQSCIGCHQVHNSTDVALIKGNNIDDGCLNCHGETAVKGLLKDKMPAELIYKGHNHPTGLAKYDAKVQAPMKTQTSGKFSCVSCHDPHMQQNKNNPMQRGFLRTDSTIKNMDDFCVKCHENNKPVLDSDHSEDVKSSVIANPRTKRKASTCDKCHTVHNATAKKGIPSMQGTFYNSDDLCLSCHKKGGDAKEKPLDLVKGHAIGVVKKLPNNLFTRYLTKGKGGEFILECSTCHDPHKNGPKKGTEGTLQNSFLKQLDSRQNFCISCHQDEKYMANSAHNVNNFTNKDSKIKGLIEQKDLCGACHTMHDGEKGFLMAGKNTETRCLQCHDKGKMSTKLAMSSHKPDVDVKDKKALPLDNGKVYCGTCHEPHLATKNLVRTSTGREDDVCMKCHDDKKLVTLSRHNMTINESKKLAGVADTNVCQACHNAHNFPKDNPLMLKEKVPNNSRLIEASCVSCHKKGGAAADKAPKYLRHSSVMRQIGDIPSFKEFLYDAKRGKTSKGNIDCSTCHDPHVWSSNPAKRIAVVKSGVKFDGDNTTSFLKADVAKNFCIACHSNPEDWFSEFHTDVFRGQRKQIDQRKPLLERLFNF